MFHFLSVFDSSIIFYKNNHIITSLQLYLAYKLLKKQLISLFRLIF